MFQYTDNSINVVDIYQSHIIVFRTILKQLMKYKKKGYSCKGEVSDEIAN
jgi:hypothetical protein